MELSAGTVEHLRNEAIAALCRETIDEHLGALERELEEIESTRSPFAMFARRETREAFDRSLGKTRRGADALKQRRAQVDQIESRLLPLLRADLETYLENVSPDYLQPARCSRLIDVWQRKLRELSDALLAFARELRELRVASPGEPRLRAIASARDRAQRLEAVHLSLAAIAREVAAVLQGSASGARLPELPELRRVAWVQRLAVLPEAQIEADAAGVEAETREFLARGLEAACARARECHTLCQQVAERYLEQYWAQLRTYAKQHYVQELDLDEAIEALINRYVNADIIRCQQELAVDPFSIDR